MALYATLADARGDNKAEGTADDNRMLRYLRTISRRVDNDFRWSPDWPIRPIFEPYIETRPFSLTSKVVNSALNTLIVPSSLLALTGVTVGDETLTVGTHVEGWPDNTLPIRQLRLIDNSTGWYGYDCDACDEPVLVTITGTWGIHRDYANAWAKVDDIVTTALTASLTNTTLKVADVDGADLYGLTPRISAGNLLRIESEYLEATATDTANNTATVRRAVNGSTLAAHAIGADVEVWLVEDSIRNEVARQAAMMNARRGAYQTVEITGVGEVRYPVDLLSSLKAVLDEFKYDH